MCIFHILLNSCLYFRFFLIGIHSMQDWTATTRHGVTRKRTTKRLKDTGNQITKNLQLKISVNSKIIGQRKAFYKQRIPESSCARKEAVDKDIVVTSRNGDRKIRITSRPPSRKRRWNQLSQFWRTSTKVIPIEDLHWPHFDDEPRVEEKQQV